MATNNSELGMHKEGINKRKRREDEEYEEKEEERQLSGRMRIDRQDEEIKKLKEEVERTKGEQKKNRQNIESMHQTMLSLAKENEIQKDANERLLRKMATVDE